MEEIEYLEEYEDLILPAIGASTIISSGIQQTGISAFDKNSGLTTTTTASRAVEDEDSSSIDQDIFERLFNDNSDDEALLSNKIDPKMVDRRDTQDSLDSLDMLVKDLGEQLSQPCSINISSSLNTTAPNLTNIDTPSSLATETIKERTNVSVCNEQQEKPKSIATVRPTVQSVQHKGANPMRTSTNHGASAVRSTLSAHGAGCSSVGVHATASVRTQISTITSTTSTSSGSNDRSNNLTHKLADSKAATAVQKKSGPPPTPTIIKPQKLKLIKDPIDDPLGIELGDISLNNESDSSFLYTSDDSFASFDLNEVSELAVNAKKKPKSNNTTKTTIKTSSTSFLTAASNDKTEKEVNAAKSMTRQSTASCSSSISASVQEIAKQLPEKVTILSDTILTCTDTSFLKDFSEPEPKKIVQSDIRKEAEPQKAAQRGENNTEENSHIVHLKSTEIPESLDSSKNTTTTKKVVEVENENSRVRVPSGSINEELEEVFNNVLKDIAKDEEKDIITLNLKTKDPEANLNDHIVEEPIKTTTEENSAAKEEEAQTECNIDTENSVKGAAQETLQDNVHVDNEEHNKNSPSKDSAKLQEHKSTSTKKKNINEKSETEEPKEKIFNNNKAENGSGDIPEKIKENDHNKEPIGNHEEDTTKKEVKRTDSLSPKTNKMTLNGPEQKEKTEELKESKEMNLKDDNDHKLTRKSEKQNGKHVKESTVKSIDEKMLDSKEKSNQKQVTERNDKKEKNSDKKETMSPKKQQVHDDILGKYLLRDGHEEPAKRYKRSQEKRTKNAKEKSSQKGLESVEESNKGHNEEVVPQKIAKNEKKTGDRVEMTNKAIKTKMELRNDAKQTTRNTKKPRTEVDKEKSADCGKKTEKRTNVKEIKPGNDKEHQLNKAQSEVLQTTTTTNKLKLRTAGEAEESVNGTIIKDKESNNEKEEAVKKLTSKKEDKTATSNTKNNLEAETDSKTTPTIDKIESPSIKTSIEIVANHHFLRKRLVETNAGLKQAFEQPFRSADHKSSKGATSSQTDYDATNPRSPSRAERERKGNNETSKTMTLDTNKLKRSRNTHNLAEQTASECKRPRTEAPKSSSEAKYDNPIQELRNSKTTGVRESEAKSMHNKKPASNTAVKGAVISKSRANISAFKEKDSPQNRVTFSEELFSFNVERCKIEGDDRKPPRTTIKPTEVPAKHADKTSTNPPERRLIRSTAIKEHELEKFKSEVRSSRTKFFMLHNESAKHDGAGPTSATRAKSALSPNKLRPEIPPQKSTGSVLTFSEWLKKQQKKLALETSKSNDPPASSKATELNTTTSMNQLYLNKNKSEAAESATKIKESSPVKVVKNTAAQNKMQKTTGTAKSTATTNATITTTTTTDSLTTEQTDGNKNNSTVVAQSTEAAATTTTTPTEAPVTTISTLATEAALTTTTATEATVTTLITTTATASATTTITTAATTTGNKPVKRPAAGMQSIMNIIGGARVKRYRTPLPQNVNASPTKSQIREANTETPTDEPPKAKANEVSADTVKDEPPKAKANEVSADTATDEPPKVKANEASADTATDEPPNKQTMFKVPTEPISNTKKSLEHKLLKPTEFKCRKVRVRINRSVVKAYFQKLNAALQATLEHKVSACDTAASKPRVPTKSAMATGSITPTTTSSPSTTVPSTTPTTTKPKPALALASSPLKSTTMPKARSTRSSPATIAEPIPTRLRTKIAGRANVTTPAPNRRPPVSTSAAVLSTTTVTTTITTTTDCRSSNNSSGKEKEVSSAQQSTASAEYNATSFLLSTLQSSQGSVTLAGGATLRSRTIAPPPTEPSVDTEIMAPSSTLGNINACTDGIKIEQLDESITAAASLAVGNVDGLNISSAGSNFGLSPTALDVAGMRMYSFLHPAKYSVPHSQVLLDYCCPNLDGPMPAIDPTRIHAQVQSAVRELPANIVMTTKLITRADLQMNKGNIPASIRQKVERITTASKPAASALKETAAVTNTPIIATTAPAATAITTSASLVQTYTSAGEISSSHRKSTQKTLTYTIQPKKVPKPLGAIQSASVTGSAPANSSLSYSHTPLQQDRSNMLRLSLRRLYSEVCKQAERLSDLNAKDLVDLIDEVILNDSGRVMPSDVDNAVGLLQLCGKLLPLHQRLQTGQEKKGDSGTTNKSSLATSKSNVAINPKTNTCGTLHRTHEGHEPIYDREKKIIGWKLKVSSTASTSTTSTTFTTTTASTTNVLAVSGGSKVASTNTTMATRSHAMSTSSTLRSAVKTSTAATPTTATPYSSVKLPVQGSPRVFYTKPLMHTSTPIEPRSANTRSYAASVALNVSKPLVKTPFPQKQLKKTPSGISLTNSKSKKKFLKIARVTRNTTNNTPPLSKTPPTKIITAATETTTTSTKVTLVAADTTHTGRNTRRTATAAGIGRSTRRTNHSNAGGAPKLIVVNTDGNSMHSTDECILPDNTGVNATASAIVKKEQIEDDFIG